jgi:hypothetical protein
MGKPLRIAVDNARGITKPTQLFGLNQTNAEPPATPAFWARPDRRSAIDGPACNYLARPSFSPKKSMAIAAAMTTAIKIAAPRISSREKPRS